MAARQSMWASACERLHLDLQENAADGSRTGDVITNANSAQRSGVVVSILYWVCNQPKCLLHGIESN